MNTIKCNKMNFSECELAILRMAVDKADEKISRRAANLPEIKEIIGIVEDFIIDEQLVCYGGTAINNILPRSLQFYDKNTEIPDYDFFSYNAFNHAKMLADIYFKNGYTDVEAKSGMHEGTYKVFVNFIPVADITQLNNQLFKAIKKEAIKIDQILYAPPNFLRMSMYLELSRPAGDISRWEKVLKRLTLLNKEYPIKVNCSEEKSQQKMINNENEKLIFNTLKKTFSENKVVFFGNYALFLYSQHKDGKPLMKSHCDFDVLANNPERIADIVKDKLEENGISKITIKKHKEIGEIIPMRYELKIGDDIVASIYKPIGCHSYNVITKGGVKLRIASIDTILSFYLAFLYANKPYYNACKNKLLCAAQMLFDIQKENRLSQRGILKRFSIICYGHQSTIEEARGVKAEKFNELRDKKGSKEYEMWFLNYKPCAAKNNNNITKHSNKTKSKRKTKKKKTLDELLYGKPKNKNTRKNGIY